MTTRLFFRFGFSASHRLAAGDMHQCSRLHGHNYTGELDIHLINHKVVPGPRWVIDTGELKAMWEEIAILYDHCHLNETLGEDSPTVEVLARRLFEHWTNAMSKRNKMVAPLDQARVGGVTVWEGERTGARYVG